MIPHRVRAVTALGVLALAQSVFAIDFSNLNSDGEQCDMSSIYGDYQAPKYLAEAQTEIVKGISRAHMAAEKQAMFEWLTANAGTVKRAAFSVQLINRVEIVDRLNSCRRL